MQPVRWIVLAVLVALSSAGHAQQYYGAGGGGTTGSVLVLNDELTIGADGGVGSTTTPAAGMKLSWQPVSGWIRDLALISQEGEIAKLRVQNEYFLLESTDGGVKDLYLSGENTVLFNQWGTKAYLSAPRSNGDRLQIGSSGFASVSGDADDNQWIQAFDSELGQTNWIGGNLRISGGRGTGTGTPGRVEFWNATALGSSGTTLQTQTERFRIDDAPQWIDSGTKPTCNAGNRGKVWYDAGGAGVADTLEVCRKSAADAYAWTALF
jgi:hypothetical protein